MAIDSTSYLNCRNANRTHSVMSRTSYVSRHTDDTGHDGTIWDEFRVILTINNFEIKEKWRTDRHQSTTVIVKTNSNVYSASLSLTPTTFTHKWRINSFNRFLNVFLEKHSDEWVCVVALRDESRNAENSCETTQWAALNELRQYWGSIHTEYAECERLCASTHLLKNEKKKQKIWYRRFGLWRMEKQINIVHIQWFSVTKLCFHTKSYCQV